MLTSCRIPAVLSLALLVSSEKRAPQQPSCKMEVVPCNYGTHYSGTVSWSSTLIVRQSAPGVTRSDRHWESVNVTITSGRAVCAGTAEENRETSGDHPTRGKLRAAITGKALFAVEFSKDENGKDYYLVTVACPSAAGTDSTLNVKTGVWDGNGITSTPPELDGREMQSDKQPATSVGMDVKGSITFTHPAEDRANGVTGTITVNWDLKRRP